VSPIYRLCSKGHGLYQGKCEACYRADNQRRAAKQRAAGRTTARWRWLKQQAKENAGYRCQVCGVPEAPTPAGWLDVHLRDRSRSHSDSSLTVADLIVTCKPHHGAYHAAEAQGGGVTS
jgi:hypothetical protein